MQDFEPTLVWRVTRVYMSNKSPKSVGDSLGHGPLYLLSCSLASLCVPWNTAITFRPRWAFLRDDEHYYWRRTFLINRWIGWGESCPWREGQHDQRMTRNLLLCTAIFPSVTNQVKLTHSAYNCIPRLPTDSQSQVGGHSAEAYVPSVNTLLLNW